MKKYKNTIVVAKDIATTNHKNTVVDGCEIRPKNEAVEASFEFWTGGKSVKMKFNQKTKWRQECM